MTRIVNLDYEPAPEKKDLIKSSEKFSKFILLKDVFKKAGDPLFNLNGEIIGLITSSNSGSDLKTALPVNYIKSAFTDILKYKKIERSFLGVNYIDLASVLGLKNEISQGLERGALLYENKDLKIKAVTPESPAASAGLKSGDIILKVDDEELSSRRDLTSIIQEYQAGDSIDLSVLRDGKEQTIKIKLEELK
jgi:serine protease Do